MRNYLRNGLFTRWNCTQIVTVSGCRCVDAFEKFKRGIYSRILATKRYLFRHEDKFFYMFFLWFARILRKWKWNTFWNKRHLISGTQFDFASDNTATAYNLRISKFNANWDTHTHTWKYANTTVLLRRRAIAAIHCVIIHILFFFSTSHWISHLLSAISLLSTHTGRIDLTFFRFITLFQHIVELILIKQTK